MKPFINWRTAPTTWIIGLALIKTQYGVWLEAGLLFGELRCGIAFRSRVNRDYPLAYSLTAPFAPMSRGTSEAPE